MCSVSAARWIYGAFPGVAKPLANGAVSFKVLIAGFLITILGSLGMSFHFEGFRIHTVLKTNNTGD